MIHLTRHISTPQLRSAGMIARLVCNKCRQADPELLPVVVRDLDRLDFAVCRLRIDATGRGWRRRTSIDEESGKPVLEDLCRACQRARANPWSEHST